MKRDGSGNEVEVRRVKAYEAVSTGKMSQREAARLFNVCAKTIRKMIRGEITSQPVEEESQKLSSQELAEARASSLSDDMTNLFVGTRYPVINPEAMHVAPSISYRVSKVDGSKVPVEGAPRTWLSDTLRVKPIKRPNGRVFVFTGAQNDTPIHEPFWNNLKAYADARNAEIIVGPWTYETNWWDENNPASRSYAPQIQNHLCFGQMLIGDNFLFAGEMNTLPTAARPINDLTTYTEGKWGVFPHGRIQLLSVPATNPAEQAFQIMTTGAVTVPQVIPRKAGIKSLSFHSIGATVVEFDAQGDFFCRQIIADKDGSFQDLDVKVSDGAVTFGNTVEAVTTADLHTAKLGSKNSLATFGFDYKTGKTQGGSIIEVLKPSYVFAHDIHDHESRNHHHKDDVSHKYEMAIRGRESVREEVKRSASFLEYLRARVDNVMVVESNHDIALERYIREGRYRGDGVNHRFGLELDQAYHEWREDVAQHLDAELSPPKFSLLEHAVHKVANSPLDNVSWIYDGDSFVLNGVQLGFHGFRGANGAKGTVTGFARMGHKITIGDKHSPQILDRVYCAGAMELQHGYNKGPSGWATSHVVQYENGHRALITMQAGKWRAKFS